MKIDFSSKRHRLSPRSLWPVLIATLWSLVSVHAGADTPADHERILARFFPYQEGKPKAEGISSGMTIDKTNAQVVRDALPPELLDHVAAGEFSFIVQDTTDTPLRKEYIDATLAQTGKVTIGGATLQNYVAGLPFPLIDPQDPQAGLKGAWNYRYRDRGDSVQYWPTNEHRTGSGAVERSEAFYIAMKFGPDRLSPTDTPPREAEGVFSKRYMRVVAPSDAEGRQIRCRTVSG